MAKNFKGGCAVLDTLHRRRAGAYPKLRHRETGFGLDISSVLATGLDHIRRRVWGGRRDQLAKRMGSPAKLGRNDDGEPIVMAGSIHLVKLSQSDVFNSRLLDVLNRNTISGEYVSLP